MCIRDRYLAVAGYIVYLIATRQWWFLLALPAFVLAFFAYQPSSAMILGPLRIAAIAAAIIGLVVSVVFRGRGFTAAFAVLIVEWLSYKIMYSVSVSAFLRAVAKHEELFERCWNGGLIGIWLPDGTRHWSDRKYESGQFVTGVSPISGHHIG